MRVSPTGLVLWFAVSAPWLSASAQAGQVELGVFRSDSAWTSSPTEFVSAEIDDRTGELLGLVIQSSERGATTRRISVAELRQGIGPTLSGGLGILMPVERPFDPKKGVRFLLRWNDAQGRAQSREIRFQRLGTEWAAFYIIRQALVSIDAKGREHRVDRVVPIDVVTFSRDEVGIWDLVNTERVGKVVFGVGPMQSQAVGLGLSKRAWSSLLTTGAAVSARRNKLLAEHENEILERSADATPAR